MVRRRHKKAARMDAAVDAMAEFGFPEKKVKKHVRLLLKVYGGDDGWRFIEEYSYKELLDAMLRDVGQEQLDGGTSARDEGPGDNSSPANTAIDVGTSTRDVGASSGANTQPESSQTNNHEIISGMSTLQPGNSLSPSGKLPPCYDGIESDDVAVQLTNSLPPGGQLPPCYGESDGVAVQLANSISPGGNLPPCYGGIESEEVAVQPANSLYYGWIESDESEDEFVYLKKMPGRFGEKSPEKRRSRWDFDSNATTRPWKVYTRRGKGPTARP